MIQKFKTNSLVFLSTALLNPVKWVGVPSIKLDYSSSASGFAQYNFEIFEVLANGQQRFINRVNYMDRSYTANARKQATFKGQGHAHLFSTGSKIKIKITNFDRVKEDSAFFGASSPFVLPSMKNGTHNVYLSNNCYIDLPVMGSTQHAFHFESNPNEEGINNPVDYKLSQNFPNPFNPSTMIEYSIAAAGNVEIKVYDVTGREVQTLVNQLQNPGSYNVLFNASNLSSGVYFYKLVSGNYSDIKKMILVK